MDRQNEVIKSYLSSWTVHTCIPKHSDDPGLCEIAHAVLEALGTDTTTQEMIRANAWTFDQLL